MANDLGNKKDWTVSKKITGQEMEHLESFFEKIEKIMGQEMKHWESLLEEMEQLILGLRRRVKASSKRGVAGAELLRFAGGIASDDLTLMQDAIEKGCEQVRPNEW